MIREKGDATGQYLSAAEVAEKFNVQPSSVFKWTRQNKLPFRKTAGGMFRFPLSVVNSLWEDRFTKGIIDRRKGARFTACLTICLSDIENSAHCLNAETIDLSSSGLKFKALASSLRYKEKLADTVVSVEGIRGAIFRGPLNGRILRHESRVDGEFLGAIEFVENGIASDITAFSASEEQAAARVTGSFGEPITVTEAAKMLGVDLPLMFKLVHEGRIAFRKTAGGSFVFSRTSVEKFLRERSGDEKREEQRFTVRLPISCKVFDREGSDYYGETVDISANGLKAVLDAPYLLKYQMERGDSFEVAISGLKGPLFRESLKGSLKYFQPREYDNLAVGISLRG